MTRDLGSCHLFAVHGGRGGHIAGEYKDPGEQHWSRVRRKSGSAQRGRVLVPGRSADLSFGRIVMWEVIYQINGWTRKCVKLLLIMN